MSGSERILNEDSASEPQDQGARDPTVLEYLKDIANKFDRLREDVDDLKARANDSGGARAQEPPKDADFSSSEAESSSSSSSSSSSGGKRRRRRRRSWKKPKGKRAQSTSRSRSPRSKVKKPKAPSRSQSRASGSNKGAEPLTWGDRMETDAEEDPIDYSKEPTFQDSEGEAEEKLRVVSDGTHKLRLHQETPQPGPERHQRAFQTPQGPGHKDPPAGCFPQVGDIGAGEVG